jgi:HD-like signal output (HDOD) protein
VGAALLQSWKLPETIIEAVANHHRPVVEPKPRLSAWVHIANAVAHHASPPPGQNIHDLYIAAAVTEALGVGGDKLESMAAAVRQSFEREDRYMAMA